MMITTVAISMLFAGTNAFSSAGVGVILDHAPPSQQ
eukprot:CAMPEP_0183370974 /NCGR_PEP_ID=MMETSP0164_2-20130417/104012_1 /TAXON_ID=221442 /ORGANISM="Coccolithus pelagicus ssp braarudi, Strain PLY182g" /LENGTH=35 /DNA_ID= /DNA_START= /DNA_END= /DNA_ORIENTATION=